MRKEERGLFDKNRARVTPSEGGKNNSNSFFVIGYDSKDLLNKNIKLAKTSQHPQVSRGKGLGTQHASAFAMACCVPSP